MHSSEIPAQIAAASQLPQKAVIIEGFNMVYFRV